MKRTLIALMIGMSALALSGCEKKPENTITTGNFDVDTLFTVDGCTAYRFYDNGRAVYFTNCPGQASYASHQNNQTNYVDMTTSAQH